MIKRTILFIFFSLVYAQGWMTDYGDVRNDYGCCINETDDGNYLFVGETTFQSTDIQPGERFIKLYKLNSLGNLIWEDSLQYNQYERWIPHALQLINNQYMVSGSYIIQVGENDFEQNSRRECFSVR